MDQTVYTHNEKGQRQDIHRPSAIIPGDYEYMRVGETRKHPVDGGPGGVCHHCGKAIRWEVHFTHTPSGRHVTFGEICTSILEMSDSRIEHELVLLKRRVANEKKALMLKLENAERMSKFKAQYPDVAEYVENIDTDLEKFRFLCDMKWSLEKWGYLTTGQAEAVRRIAAKRLENAAKQLVEVQPTTPLAEGRYQVEGEVISDKYVNTVYGTQHKMLVKLDDGNKVYGTVANSIFLQVGSEVRGKRVQFVAKIERSKDDEHFGFFSRPAKAKVV